MAKLYECELGKSADILMSEMFQLRADETIIITADAESNEQAVNADARSTFFGCKTNGHLASCSLRCCESSSSNAVNRFFSFRIMQG